MVESIDPRSGSNPITGDAIEPPTAGHMANPINGHEYSTPNRDDLQYACIFPLAVPRDCASGGCDCEDPSNDNPLCQAPSGQFGTTQYYAKAYPSRRPLQVIKDIGAQGVVGSICAAQIGDDAAADFGYRPTFRAIAETLRSSLAP